MFIYYVFFRLFRFEGVAEPFSVLFELNAVQKSKQHIESLNVRATRKKMSDVFLRKVRFASVSRNSLCLTKLNSTRAEVSWPKWEYSSSNWVAPSQAARLVRINSRHRNRVPCHWCVNCFIWASSKRLLDRWRPNRNYPLFIIFLVELTSSELSMI